MTQLTTTMDTDQPRKTMRSRPWLLGLLAVLVILGGLAEVGIRMAGPRVKALALEALREKFHADVGMDGLEIHIYPILRIHGTGLAIRQEGRTDVPPLIAIREFSAEASPLSFLHKPWTIQHVKLIGLVITIPPRRDRGAKMNWGGAKDVPVLVDELVSEDGQIEILPNDSEKPHHVFELRHLAMHFIGLHRAAHFEAELTNATPPGIIHSRGTFGPWNAEDPGETPLAAVYTFNDADLGVFKGIRGILASTGKFGGVLNRIEVEGETETPDFTITVCGHPVDLHTTFQATVDGTNGNTLLHPVSAHFLHSTIVARGEVVKRANEKGRAILLDVVASQARLEDLLTLAVKGDEPALTGATSLHTAFDLPPGGGDLIERLRLKGTFKIDDAEFTNPKIRDKIEAFSRRGQGKPGDKNVGDPTPDLQGAFQLGRANITFRGLTFAVTGASVNVDGDYGIEDEKLDFRGKLRVDAKVSQMLTGFKSWLLKPVDPFFRRGHETVLPIKITGTRDRPAFGLDFHDRKAQVEETGASR